MAIKGNFAKNIEDQSDAEMDTSVGEGGRQIHDEDEDMESDDNFAASQYTQQLDQQTDTSKYDPNQSRMEREKIRQAYGHLLQEIDGNSSLMRISQALLYFLIQRQEK
jgi:phosphoribosylformylglycinamidine (FGAM) synthase-like amidotransferase family enzyme